MPDNTKTFEAEKAPTLPYVVDRLFSMNQEYEEFVNNPVNKREKKKAVSFASMLRKQLKTRVWDRQEDQLLRQLLESLHKRCPPQLKMVGKYESRRRCSVSGRAIWEERQ